MSEGQGAAAPPATRATRRVALGVSYRGSAYHGWQSQGAGVATVQGALEKALSAFATVPISVVCAGRTDAGVHGINQVVHLDTDLHREPFSWVRGANSFLPPDIAVQWAMEVPPDFHARNSARGRRYAFIVLEAPVRPALEVGQVSWVFRPLDLAAMRAAAASLIGEHDFSSFRAAQCQSPTPVKRLREIRITRCAAPALPVGVGSPDAGQVPRLPVGSAGPRQGAFAAHVYWRFDFEGQAFLHHMIRNIMGCLIVVGSGNQPPEWMQSVLDARNRDAAAPTFSPDGLYFLGPRYDDQWGLPNVTPALAWLPV
ncbi:MAG: tRNA pseudouridine(38-40) synthase TruA [Pseudomonadota bacterium]